MRRKGWIRLGPHVVRVTVVAVAVLILISISISVAADTEKAPLRVAIVWHQHQPLYWNRLTQEYELPWVRVHGVQEYIDSARISAEYPDVHVTFNLQPSLLWQLLDYASITPEEASLGGLYQHIGAVDNHLKWTWALATDPTSLSSEERALAQEQFFWLNGYMFDDDTDDPYYDSYYTALNDLADAEGLTDQELLDAAGLFLLWQTSPEMHEPYGLLEYREHAGFALEDIAVLLEAQMAILQEVVSAYRTITPLGNELITSPFYHPILPLLVENRWSNDAYGQIEQALDQHAALFGEQPLGVWCPEQAVSEASISLLCQAGFAWTSADEGLLARALERTPSVEDLTTAYEWDGVTLLFRETELSNKISFAYGNKDVAVAVDDFLGEIQAVWQQLDDPSGHVLTLAMDGENWMFLAGYANNGRTFLRALYAAMAETAWIETVTPSELLAEGLPTQPLESVPTGSWAGDLSTWSGESDEDEGWARLASAREAVVAAGDPPEAVEAIYAAQGSDWFWWYGIDQDSNTDDLYDWLFKAHLIGAYRASGAEESEIPSSLSLRLILPTPVSLGEVAPVVDGGTTDDEDWSSAAVLAGTEEIGTVRIGYLESRIYVRLEPMSPASNWIGAEQYLMLYASGAPGDPVNIATRYSGDQLGFSIAHAAQIPLAKLRSDGSGTVTVFNADGAEGWRSGSNLRTLTQRKVATGEVLEYSIPFAELGLEAGKSTTISLVLESVSGIIESASISPILAAIPTLIQGEEIYAVDDPVGDDTGTGTFTYPTSEVFSEPGLLDLQRYAVYDADDRWQFALDFGLLTNPWNGPQGFSHPIVFLYFDIQDGGSITSHEEAEAANIAFDPEHPWDRFIKVTGWPSYGRQLYTAEGEGPFLVEVASDPKRGRIIVTVPKTLLPTVSGWHYVLVASQDGYGANHVRPVGEIAGIWTGGGSPDPLWAPQIYDFLAPAEIDQGQMLSSYESGLTYAELIPIEISP